MPMPVPERYSIIDFGREDVHITGQGTRVWPINGSILSTIPTLRSLLNSGQQSVITLYLNYLH